MQSIGRAICGNGSEAVALPLRDLSGAGPRQSPYAGAVLAVHGGPVPAVVYRLVTLTTPLLRNCTQTFRLQTRQLRVMAEDTPLQDEQPPFLARLTPDEWALQCGADGCETVLAEVAWIDINYNMATNVAESQGSAPDLGDLPAPHLRRYRMGVMFPFDWKWTKESRTWELEGARPVESGRQVSNASRVVRGNWSTGELGQLGAPPFFVRCWDCGELQSVPPLRRKGTPPLGAPLAAESGSPAPATDPAKGGKLPIRPLYGAVVAQRPRRRHS